MFSPALLLLVSPALLAAGIVWPMAAEAAHRRNRTTGGVRRVELGPVHYAGPAVLISAGLALLLVARFV